MPEFVPAVIRSPPSSYRSTAAQRQGAREVGGCSLLRVRRSTRPGGHNSAPDARTFPYRCLLSDRLPHSGDGSGGGMLLRFAPILKQTAGLILYVFSLHGKGHAESRLMCSQSQRAPAVLVQLLKPANVAPGLLWLHESGVRWACSHVRGWSSLRRHTASASKRPDDR